jgi:tetratricopeptide (TPR) repeat protein
MTVSVALKAEFVRDLPPEPYPGLRPFEPSEWTIFFGREPMIDEVIARLAEQHLVIIHGASGCGKSSLVRAGILPWLDLDHARSGRAWATAIVRPSGGPLRNIARALAETLGPPLGSDNSSAEAVTEWHDRLALGSSAIAEIGQVLEAQGASLCLLIDQFEELFRYAKETSREEAQVLIEILEALADRARAEPRLFIILTMRSDYLGECARFKGFAETVNSSQYLLPQLDDFAILRAIHEPAILYGGTIDRAVGDRLVFAARQQEDALPILQHALMRACALARKSYGSQEGWTVTLADLEAIEGQHGALSQHADEILAGIAADNPMHRKVAEWLFRCLTELDAEGRIIRRPRRVADLAAVAGGDRAGVSAVIAAFRAPGRSFLTTNHPGPLEDDTEVDVSHEALIRGWRQLSDPTRDAASNQPAGWMWREFEDGQRWRALAVQARVFRDDKRKRATLSPATTDAYESWWPEHTPAWASRYARDKERAYDEYKEVEDLWQASKKARRQRATVVIAVLMLVSAFAVFAAWQWYQVGHEKQTAEQQRAFAQASEISAQAEKQRAEQEKGRAEANFVAAKQTVRDLITNIVEGLQNVVGMRAETVQRILVVVEGTITSLARSAPDDIDLEQSRAAMLTNFADIYQQTGNLTHALETDEKALTIRRKLMTVRPSNIGWQRDVSSNLIRIGQKRRDRGNLTGALEAYEEALAIARRLTAAEAGDVASHGIISVSLYRIGEVRADAGDRAGALAVSQESLTIARWLVKADPDNPQLQRGLSTSLGKVSDRLRDVGDWAGGRTAQEEALAISRRLVATDKDNTQLQRELSVDLQNIGDARRDGGDRVGALAAKEEALSIARWLVATDKDKTEWQRDLSVYLEQVGDLRGDAGDRAGARKAAEESLSIRRQLTTTDPSNLAWQHDLSINLQRIGDLRQDAGDRAGALEAQEEALAIARRLVAVDKDKIEWQHELLLILQRIGDLRRDAGDRAGALEAQEEAIAISRRLVATDKIKTVWQRDLLLILQRIGDLRRDAGDRAGALEAQEEALAIARRLVAVDKDNINLRRDISFSHQRIGDLWRDASDQAKARLKAGDRAGAFKAHEEVLSLARRLATADPNDSEWQSNLVISLRGVADASNDVARKRAALQEILRIVAGLEAQDALTIEQRLLRKNIQAELAKAAKMAR